MLWKNPIFIRFCRSELRFKKAIFWYLLTLIVTAFTVAIIYAPQVYRGHDAVSAARQAFVPILIIQGVILLFMGTGSVASGITREKVDNVLNYQRLTPLPVHDKVLGYLFGLPVRHYVMFGITLPFTAFVLIVGRIPPSAFIPYYLIFFSSTLLYHFTGMVAGMISRKWRWSARISQGLIILLYFVLPNLSHLGLVFLEFLTVRPAFVEHIFPLVGPHSNFRMEGIGLLAGKTVPIFTITISGTIFTFMIQAGLITLFAAIVARKWKADTVPSISKLMAFITFTVFSVMSLGNLWPNLTRSENALDILKTSGDIGTEIALVALPLTLALTTTTLAFILMISALPDPLQYRLRQIRARRMEWEHLPRWADDANGYLLTSLLFLVQLILLTIVLITMDSSGYFDQSANKPVFGAFIILAVGLTLFYFQGLKENFGGGRIAFFILIGWAIPILAAILIIAIDQSRGETALLVAALSPVTLIPLSATQLVDPANYNDNAIIIQRALAVGLLFMTAMNAWLHWRLWRGRRQ